MRLGMLLDFRVDFGRSGFGPLSTLTPQTHKTTRLCWEALAVHGGSGGQSQTKKAPSASP